LTSPLARHSSAPARGEERGFVRIVGAEELAEYRRRYPQSEQEGDG
jgi:hypothetical protein